MNMPLAFCTHEWQLLLSLCLSRNSNSVSSTEYHFLALKQQRQQQHLCYERQVVVRHQIHSHQRAVTGVQTEEGSVVDHAVVDVVAAVLVAVFSCVVQLPSRLSTCSRS